MPIRLSQTWPKMCGTHCNRMLVFGPTTSRWADWQIIRFLLYEDTQQFIQVCSNRLWNCRWISDAAWTGTNVCSKKPFSSGIAGSTGLAENPDPNRSGSTFLLYSSPAPVRQRLVFRISKRIQSRGECGAARLGTFSRSSVGRRCQQRFVSQTSSWSCRHDQVLSLDEERTSSQQFKVALREPFGSHHIRFFSFDETAKTGRRWSKRKSQIFCIVHFGCHRNVYCTWQRDESWIQKMALGLHRIHKLPSRHFHGSSRNLWVP